MAPHATHIVPALKEIAGQCREPDRWLGLAAMDISLRYRRTVLGPLWLTLTLGATVGSLGVVYAGLFRQDVGSFLPSFAIGLVVWMLIATMIQEGASIFVASGGLIKAVPAPLIVHVLQMTARNAIVFLHHAVLIALLYVVMPWPLSWSLLLVVPAIAIVMVGLAGAAILLATLCARYRDVAPAVSGLLQLGFFLSPVIWTRETIAATPYAWLMQVNPFAVFIELVRKPILSHPLAAADWATAAAISSVTLAASLYCYARYRHSVAYWL